MKSQSLKAGWCIIGAFFLMVTTLNAQKLSPEQYKADSSKVVSLNRDFDQKFKEQDYENAILFASQAIAISNKIGFEFGQGLSLYNLGKIYKEKKDLSQGLNYLLQSQIIFEKIKSEKNLAESNYEIGNLYIDWNTFNKSVSYLKSALNLFESLNDEFGKEKSLNALGFAFYQNGDFDKAKEIYEEALVMANNTNNHQQSAIILDQLSNISKDEKNFEQAIVYLQNKRAIHEQDKDYLSLGITSNNIGYLYRQLGENEESIDYFNRGLEAFNHLNTDGDRKNASLMDNIGVTYTNLKSFNKAEKYFYESLKLHESNKDLEGLAGSYNYLAANNFISGYNDKAYSNVQKAIEAGEKINARKELIESYFILSEIYAKFNDFKNSQEAYKKHEALKKELEDEANQLKEERRQEQLFAEKKENELRLIIADKEKQALSLKQLKLEAEKKEQALALQQKQLSLLTKEKELQKQTLENQALEKKRAQQALALAQQQIEAQSREREIANLERERELQDLAIKQKELEEEKQQKAMQLLEADKKLKDQQLLEEERFRYYGYGILGLFLVIMGIIAYGFVQKKKSNKMLLSQREEIKEKNEELESNMERLQSAQQLMKKQKEKLEETNIRITDSIKYANRIQSAILPNEKDLAGAFEDHFVVYMPKDMVSGDFYWFAHVDGKSFIAAVDCTGHGVPGAFMSMIGNSLLNQVVKERKIRDTDKILEELHYGVREALRQNESKNVDGMDICLCSLEQKGEEIVMNYSGAKCPLFLINDGQITEFNPDRKSIGGWQKENEHKFERKETIVKPGDYIYLTTDGIIDTPNEKRRRFGTSNLKNLLEKIASKSMGDQKDEIMATLIEYSQNTPQRDDVTLIGIQVKKVTKTSKKLA
ncbi:tetratricopeptide repeat protein [Flexithrix dorotheae]|uniref:tetratricopeptide repeat protein n=1 Tax=Flexithrix dorotheae TaxID=70993 RepID=UPI0003741843|nr:tetratricopeptide repeat protein [Flexithrix dorotheae]